MYNMNSIQEKNETNKNGNQQTPLGKFINDYLKENDSDMVDLAKKMRP